MTNTDFRKKILETIWDIIEEAQDEVEHTGGLMADEGCPAGPLAEEQERFVRHVAEKLSDIRTDIAGAINEAETAEKKEADAVPEKKDQQAAMEKPAPAELPVHIRIHRPELLGDNPDRQEELKVLKEAIAGISTIQKECGCRCTLEVDMNW